MDVYAWITSITVITVMGVLLLTKIRTDAVFLIAVNTSFATACLTFPLTPLP